MNLINKVLHKANIAIVYFAMACLVAMAFITVTGVLLRYVFNTGLQWGEEITLVLVIWFTFIALAMGVRLNLHIHISILPGKLPAAVEVFLTKLKQSLILATGIIFLLFGWKLVEITSRSILPATGLPNAIMYLPVPVSSILIILDGFFSLIGLDKGVENLEDSLGGGTKQCMT